MALKKQQEAEEQKQKEWRVAVVMRGGIVTGAELDGWDQEQEKTASEKGDILLAPLEQHFCPLMR